MFLLDLPVVVAYLYIATLTIVVVKSQSTTTYPCQTLVFNKLLLAPTMNTDGNLISYNKRFPPILNNNNGGTNISSSSNITATTSSIGDSGSQGVPVDVYTSIHVSNYSISNYGVNGGAIEIDGIITSTWNDYQLQWNPNDVGGCTEIQLHASNDLEKSDIWTPFRRSTTNDNEDVSSLLVTSTSDTMTTVSYDGNVVWKRKFKLDFSCRQIWEEDSKHCSYTMSVKDGTLLNKNYVNYIVAGSDNITNNENSITTAGISIEDKYLIPGYEINKDQLSMKIVQSQGEVKTEGSAADDNTEIIITAKLDPLEKSNCYVCRGIKGSTIKNDTIPSFFNFGLGNNDTCRQIEDYDLLNSVVGDDSCYFATTFYSHQCCDNLPPIYNCESNIREHILEKFDSNGNTIIPPDPQDGGTMVDVGVSLDVTHILDLDIKSNTLEVLVSLELVWEDPQVAWDSFIGQCHTVSFRASLDPDYTEIWVPELDLLNQVEGASAFPDSFATAFDNGLIWWKRTGILKVACDMQGIKYFPFDNPTCSLDFGSSRVPLAHRVNYTIGDIEFSDRLKNRADYQEYNLKVDLSYDVTVESELLSGFDNKFIRFHLVFDRAVPYYIWAFIVLYILFTYMAFGMFFLDVQVGERLGYGTGILFVIVAQDITVAEYTPITQNQLWISQVSYGSKIFVIFGIIQTIIILHYYFVNDLNGDGIDNPRHSSTNTHKQINESEKLIGKVTDNENDISSDNDFAENGQLVQPFSRTEEDNEGLTSPETTTRNDINDTNPSAIPMRRKINRLTSTSRFLVTHMLGYKTQENESVQIQKVLKLRLIDRITAIIFFVTYTVFLIVMFAIGISRSGQD